MMPHQDPSAFQAWLIAIPSAITALSTWYINRKTVKTSEKAHSKTEALVTESASDLNDKVLSLESRIAKLEEQMEKTRNCQIILAQKHTESMTSVAAELKNARMVIQKSMNPQASTKVTETKAEPEDPGKVIVVEQTSQPIGKVIRKP